MTTRFRVRAKVGEHTQPLGGLVVLGERPLQRERGPFGQCPYVAAADPRDEVIGQPVGLLVGPGDDDDRPRGRKARAPDGEVRGARGPGHTKDARLRQMGPKGVDERCDAAITAARRGHARRNGTGAGQLGRSKRVHPGRQAQPARGPGQRGGGLPS